MRMSCNGCRVLRKGCSENCSIKPCLQWIKSPESQANATVFLAKFYGRAGLMNLINAGPEHLRPAIFRSLLYEACGRIVNPIYGSVGLLWSGNWQLCQNAVEAVLEGAPVSQIESEAAETNNGPPLKACDIRHVNKNEKSEGSGGLHRVRTGCRFKRSAVNKPKVVAKGWVGSGDDESAHEEGNRSTSHESSLSHQSEAARNVEGESQDTESLASEETGEAEAGALERAEPELSSEKDERAGDGEIELELTLGLESTHSRTHGVKAKEVSKRIHEHAAFSVDGVCRMELGLD
ncbi:LOB domain-containing protein 41-like [Coffea arabica]|uniref:LOB domain-containing protein 41-like n=1 Tax=Coffea arabica TaxID=13443 RepID=A0A6P6TG02_COFAR|nr:LOB domain-containing protein 41-like [Coffea arabica]XP_027077531.1 LOB domain-containing protein 41-like [Coffea arabica]